MNEKDVFTRRMFIKGMATSFGALPVFAWPRWAQAFYYNLGFFKKGSGASSLLYVEDVFSTYLYTGNGSTQTISNGIALTSTATGGTSVGQQAYTTPGTYSWTCPNGVSSVCVVCIGGGAGGSINSGGDSTFTVGATVVKGSGGGASPGTGSGGDANYSGGSGGGSSSYYAGGGGAAGYAGNGGTGNQGGGTFSAPSGGGGAGGDSITTYGGNGGSGRTGGGGVGIFGLGSNATGYGRGGSGGADGITSGSGGTGGAYGGAGGNTGANTNSPGCGGGLAYKNNISVVPGTAYTVIVGAGGASSAGNGAGGSGAIRIIWGSGRAFPSTLTADQTTVNNNDATVIAGSGLVWIKARDAAYSHRLLDTERNALGNRLSSDTTESQTVNTPSTGLATPLANGFSLGVNSSGQEINNSGVKFTSWTFRKAAKFFDVVTYSGDGSSSRQISHNLGVVPGMIIVKKASGAINWHVYHKDLLSQDHYLYLNTTDAQLNNGSPYLGMARNASTFTVSYMGGTGGNNENGQTYVAYLFAHDTGTDGLIRCGSYISDGGASTPAINLGWEPQFVLIKRSEVGTGNWFVFDNMRGAPIGADNTLYPNLSNAEYTSDNFITFLPTGFQPQQGAPGVNDGSNSVYIYMAIRRGPMKTPTAGTQVLDIYSDATSNTTHTVNFNVTADAILQLSRSGSVGSAIHSLNARMTSISLPTYASFSESSFGTVTFNYGISPNNSVGLVNAGGNSTSAMNYAFKRAPGFFDQVCYKGNQQTSAITVSHNLSSAPELIIIKKRNNTGDWIVKHKDLGDDLKFIRFNSTSGVNAGSTSYWNNTAPTAATFTVGTDGDVNGGGAADIFVAYLFASCSGVSKIGSFTGSASDVTVSCGFSGQPRFVLVKRTDSTGDWIVVDATRGTGVYSTPNVANPETSATVITFTTGGFVAKAGTVANSASGATYIFLAIA